MVGKNVLVLMSSFNGEKYIKEQIQSIMSQVSEYQIDLCIRDDGSNDSTCTIVQEMQKEYPGRIELIVGERKGYNESFFSLIKGASNYTYYALSDQDDVWLPDKIQTACEKLCAEANDIPLLYASTSFLVGDDLKPYGTTRKMVRSLSFYNTIIQNICPGHTQVMNNALLNLINVDIDYSKIYVYDSWITNVAMLYGKILFDNDSHTYYRQHKRNQLGSGASKIQKIITSKKRIFAGGGSKYREQIRLFYKTFSHDEKLLKYYDELQKFLTAQSFISRLNYILGSKLYRQSRVETIAIYIAIVFGLF